MRASPSGRTRRAARSKLTRTASEVFVSSHPRSKKRLLGRKKQSSAHPKASFAKRGGRMRYVDEQAQRMGVAGQNVDPIQVLDAVEARRHSTKFRVVRIVDGGRVIVGPSGAPRIFSADRSHTGVGRLR
jgi:hypothetical protein